MSVCASIGSRRDALRMIRTPLLAQAIAQDPFGLPSIRYIIDARLWLGH